MEKITTRARESRAAGPLWETLEQYARGEIQQFVQRLLEEEVEELLGRRRVRGGTRTRRRGCAMATGNRGSSR